MRIVNQFWATIWAGYLNKTRTYRFLVILGLVIAAGYAFVPAPNAHYVTLGWGSSSTFYRGVYNSAWIGALIALLSEILLALFGFYMVNDNIKRDEVSRVGEVIATTPVSNCVYIIGNVLSSFAVLMTMVFIIVLTAVGMQFFYGEALSLDLYALCGPFTVFVIPVILLVGSLAILFESIPSLHGTKGNILYVFMWLFGVPILSDNIDLFGNNIVISSMREAGRLIYPLLSQNEFILGYAWGFPVGRTLETFIWNGLEYSSGLLFSRLLLIFTAISISVLASFRFTRFDPDFTPVIYQEPQDHLETARDSYLEDSVITQVNLDVLEIKSFSFSVWPMLEAELRLVLNETRISFLLGLFFLVSSIFIGYLLPIELARTLFLPLVWIMPVFVWSKLGSREAQHHTKNLVFCSVRPVLRHLTALWLIGFLVSLATGGGVALNLVLNGTRSDFIAWLVGALFIPSFALCSGVLTGSGKFFEFLYTLLWYIGPLSGNVSLDFMASTLTSVQLGYWKYYLVFSIILIFVTYIIRLYQIQRE